jgi:hypothetical protein
MQKPLCPICYSDLNIRNDHRREGVCYCQNCGKKILLNSARKSAIRMASKTIFVMG